MSQIKKQVRGSEFSFLQLQVLVSWLSGELWVLKGFLGSLSCCSLLLPFAFQTFPIVTRSSFYSAHFGLFSIRFPAWLGSLQSGTAPSVFFCLGHLYAPFGFDPRSSNFSHLLILASVQNFRFSHSLICNYIAPSLEKKKKVSSGL